MCRGLRPKTLDPRLDWHEWSVLIKGLVKDRTSTLRQDIDPDWEWDTNLLMQSWQLYVLMGGNWQRSGGKGEKPKLIDAKALRGEAEMDEHNTNRTGVQAGKRQTAAISVTGADDLTRVGDVLAARAEKLRKQKQARNG